MPEPTDGYAAGVIAGRMIMTGGTYWEGTPGNWQRKIYSKATFAFDPVTNVWERLPDAPVALAYAASAVVGDELFILGGMQDGLASRDIYVLKKIATGFAWRHFGQLPETRVFANGVALGRSLFVIGGNREFEPFDAKGTCCTSLTAANTVWQLDTVNPAAGWKSLPGYPGNLRWLHKAATDGKAIYLFGGVFSIAENIPAKKINEVLRLDPRGGWSRATDLPESLQIAAPVGIVGRIVLVSGSADVMLFEPATATFFPLAALPAKATVTQFVWIAPFLVGAGGESDPEGPRRRSEKTFVGRVDGPPPALPLVP
jgi:N-acetylneuraminic acid mutarotase